MSALMVVNYRIKNSEKLKEYSSKTAALFQKFGGELVHRGKSESLFGNSDPRFDTTVIYRFGSREAVKNWYDSPEYQQILALRDEAMDSAFGIVS